MAKEFSKSGVASDVFSVVCSSDLRTRVPRLVNIKHADVVVFGLVLRLRVDLSRVEKAAEFCVRN